MAPTPINATHRLSFYYKPFTVRHATQFFVSAAPSGDSSGYDLATNGSSIGVSAAVTMWKNLWKPNYPSGVSLDSWTLFEYVSGAYIPLVSGSIGQAGSGSGAIDGASQVTIFGRDIANKGFKVELFDQLADTAFKHSSFTPGDSLDDIAISLADGSAGHLGFWVRSRADASGPFRMLSVVGTLNRKLRRKYGLA